MFERAQIRRSALFNLEEKKEKKKNNQFLNVNNKNKMNNVDLDLDLNSDSDTDMAKIKNKEVEPLEVDATNEAEFDFEATDFFEFDDDIDFTNDHSKKLREQLVINQGHLKQERNELAAINRACEFEEEQTQQLRETKRNNDRARNKANQEAQSIRQELIDAVMLQRLVATRDSLEQKIQQQQQQK